MKKATKALPFLIFLFSVTTSVYSGATYKVIFETMDCSGSTGFSTVSPDQIHKVEDGDCFHPDNPEQKLKKILIHDGQGSYQVLYLSQEEARDVMLELKDYMGAKKEALRNSDSIIISQ